MQPRCVYSVLCVMTSDSYSAEIKTKQSLSPHYWSAQPLHSSKGYFQQNNLSIMIMP